MTAEELQELRADLDWSHGAGMPDIDLEAIRARAEAATAGPWEIGSSYRTWRTQVVGPDGRLILRGDVFLNVDLALIVAAPTDLTALLAEVDRLREKLGDLPRLGDSAGRHYDRLILEARAERDQARATIRALVGRHDAGGVR